MLAPFLQLEIVVGSPMPENISMMGVGFISVVLALNLDLTGGIEDVDPGDPVSLIPLPNASWCTTGGSWVEEIIGELEHGRWF
jgi:hypothetical protein